MLPSERAAIYRAAANHLDVEGNWCRYAAARDGEDYPVASTDPAAASWSIVGVIRLACARREHRELLHAEMTSLLGCEPAHFNDMPGTSRGQVVDMLRWMAETVEKQS